ncbi:MAG: hypothetical protein ACI3WQ_11875 [Faecousia sp.]
MGIFKKKPAPSQYNVLSDETTRAYLPSYGQALDNFQTPIYTFQKATVLKERYDEAISRLKELMSTCDRHSSGSEGNHFIDAQVEHCYAFHETEISTHELQGSQITASRQTRAEALKMEIPDLEEKETQLKAEIGPLQGLHRRSVLHIGHFTISLGLPATFLAMLIDAATVFSAVQAILFGNMYMLAITVLGFALMSDGSAWKLADYINHKDDKFTYKWMFYLICGLLVTLYIAACAGSFMLQFGSMEVYGSMNVGGGFDAKDTYSMGEYAVTFLKACVPIATGVLCFSASLDLNGEKVKDREEKELELAVVSAQLAQKKAELSDLEKAPDPMVRDLRNRAAAERNIEAMRTGLKLQLGELLMVQINDPDFTERVSASGAKLVADAFSASSSNPPAPTISLDKVS